MPPTSPTPQSPIRPARPRSRAWTAAVVVAVLACVLLSGCARVRTALAVQPDDTVNGEIVLATPETSPEDRGPAITLPPALESDVDVSAYRQDGYTGSVLRFSGLTFDEVATLTGAAGPAGDGVEFTLRRAGGRVLVAGSVDLTTVSVDRADFQLKISFPGQVLESDGDVDDDTVSWEFTPGEVGDIGAMVAYDDPNAPSALNWTLGLAAVVALVAGSVVVLARRTRNPPVTPPVR